MVSFVANALQECQAILDPYYEAVRDEFVASGLDRAARTKLSVDPAVHDTERHFAACREDGLVIVVSPELAELPHETVLGILGHELGHAADFLYPARFMFDGRILKVHDDEAERSWRRRLRLWKGRDHDAVERTADAIGQHVLKVPIGYRGPCMLQHLGSGEPRPSGLR